MSLHNTDEIDAIGTDIQSGEVVLSLLDALDWDDLQPHWKLLADKLDRYLGFIESGELALHYPAALGAAMRIDILFRHPPPNVVTLQLEKAIDIASSYRCALSWRVVDASA